MTCFPSQHQMKNLCQKKVPESKLQIKIILAIQKIWAKNLDFGHKNLLTQISFQKKNWKKK